MAWSTPLPTPVVTSLIPLDGVHISPEDLVSSLTQTNALALWAINAIESHMASEDFTLEAISSLVTSLATEEETHSSDTLERSLMATFTAGNKSAGSGPSTWEALHQESERKCAIYKRILKDLEELKSIPGSI